MYCLPINLYWPRCSYIFQLCNAITNVHMCFRFHLIAQKGIFTVFHLLNVGKRQWRQFGKVVYVTSW